MKKIAGVESLDKLLIDTFHQTGDAEGTTDDQRPGGGNKSGTHTKAGWRNRHRSKMGPAVCTWNLPGSIGNLTFVGYVAAVAFFFRVAFFFNVLSRLRFCKNVRANRAFCLCTV